jgi:hypothetical protein
MGGERVLEQGGSMEQEMGRWGDGETGRVGDGENWGDWAGVQRDARRSLRLRQYAIIEFYKLIAIPFRRSRRLRLALLVTTSELLNLNPLNPFYKTVCACFSPDVACVLLQVLSHPTKANAPVHHRDELSG